MGTGINYIKWLMKALYHLHLLRPALHLLMIGYYIYFKIKNNLQLSGTHNVLPRHKEPMIIAINHSSGADAYIGFATIGGRFLREGTFVAHEKSFRKDNFEKWMLLALGAIPRIGSGERIINRMVYWLLRGKNVYIVPEGMTSNKIMRGYTGIMRVYYRANKILAKHGRHVPILPVATIGANFAYPIAPDPDGKYRPKKGGIILRAGPLIHFKLPEKPSQAWFREKTDEVMNLIAKLGLQTEGIIDSWKLNSLGQGPRKYNQ
jgi:1-acyl-sn-glycerol-3-phosphate acyltransferase